MKKIIITIISTLFTITLILFSCTKKEITGITPDYKENAGTAGNPNVNNPTVTGGTLAINTATQNSSLYVGGASWINPTCGSTNSLTIKGINGNINVSLTFASSPITGTYTLGTVAGSGICSLTIIDAPNQPAGVVWVAKTGTISVTTSSLSINASFSSIKCSQETFSLTQVTVSGTLGCLP